MKRFYKIASVGEVDGGLYSVLLDNKPIKTSSKQSLNVPTRALAEKIADEWQSQGDKVLPETMPIMTLASTTIDSVNPQRETIAINLAAYGGSDLLCYLAEHPENLVKRQHDAWQPLIDWVENKYGIKLIVTAGVVHVAQDETILAKFNDIVLGFDAYRLAAVHEFTTLSGSLVIALAVMDGYFSADEGFDVSIVDEIHQAEFWGTDEEAEERLAKRRAEFLNAQEFLTLLS